MTIQTDPPPTASTDATVGQAIAVLTALARQTRVRGEGTPAAVVEPVDFADIAAQVLNAVAANLGSVEELLAGRSGSWEADLVRSAPPAATTAVASGSTGPRRTRSRRT